MNSQIYNEDCIKREILKKEQEFVILFMKESHSITEQDESENSGFNLK